MCLSLLKIEEYQKKKSVGSRSGNSRRPPCGTAPAIHRIGPYHVGCRRSLSQVVCLRTYPIESVLPIEDQDSYAGGKNEKFAVVTGKTIEKKKIYTHIR